MGMFSRMTDIVQANINAILDKAEDPEKVIRLIIQEMEETLVELRSVAAKQIAEQKMLQRKQDSLTQRGDDWYAKAQLAMDKGKEDLARAALVERQAALSELDNIAAQRAQIDDALDKLREDTMRLTDKLTEARAKQKTLVIRKQSVGVRLQAKQVEHSQKVNDAMSRFEQYESRIEHLESQVDAYDVVPGATGNTLHDEFKALETDDAIEQELAALKKKAA